MLIIVSREGVSLQGELTIFYVKQLYVTREKLWKIFVNYNTNIIS